MRDTHFIIYYKTDIFLVNTCIHVATIVVSLHLRDYHSRLPTSQFFLSGRDIVRDGVSARARDFQRELMIKKEKKLISSNENLPRNRYIAYCGTAALYCIFQIAYDRMHLWRSMLPLQTIDKFSVIISRKRNSWRTRYNARLWKHSIVIFCKRTKTVVESRARSYQYEEIDTSNCINRSNRTSNINAITICDTAEIRNVQEVTHNSSRKILERSKDTHTRRHGSSIKNFITCQ